MKHTYIEQTVTDFGPRVVCDVCTEDWTDSPVSGGFLFDSYAYCPKCATSHLPRIKGYKEESHIRAWCPKDMSFSAWILKLRGGDNRIIFTTKETKDK